MAKVLRPLSESGSMTVDELAEVVGLPHVKVEQLTTRLSKEKLTIREVKTISRIVLTKEGQEIINKGLPENQLLEESITYVKTIGSSSPSSFRIIKQNRIEIVNDFIKRNLKEREQLFIDAWYSVKTRENLKEAMKKF